MEKYNAKFIRNINKIFGSHPNDFPLTPGSPPQSSITA